MQTSIKFSDGTTYNTKSSVISTMTLAGFRREVVTITAEMSYAQAASHFVGGATFELIDENGESFYWADYGVAGAITDNRDGTITAVMGKNNTTEQDLEQQVQKAGQGTTTLAGKHVDTMEEIDALRLAFETAASKLSDYDATIAPSLSEAWNPYRYVAQGERRYYAPTDELFKCLISHESTFENAPDASTEYWSKL